MPRFWEGLLPQYVPYLVYYNQLLQEIWQKRCLSLRIRIIAFGGSGTADYSSLVLCFHLNISICPLLNVEHCCSSHVKLQSLCNFLDRYPIGFGQSINFLAFVLIQCVCLIRQYVTISGWNMNPRYARSSISAFDCCAYLQICCTQSLFS